MSFVGPIARIAGTIVKTVIRYNRYERQLFKTAYRGVPRGVARGARHGYVAGSVIGSLIAPDSPGNDKNGFQEKQKKPKYTSRKSYQTRYRQAIRDCSGYNRSNQYRRFRR